MFHSIDQLSERFDEQMSEAVAYNLAKLDFLNGYVEMYKVKSSSNEFDVIVANNNVQISGTYGTYVFGSFSNPLMAIDKLTSHEMDPHALLPYLLSTDSTRGSMVFDLKLAQSLLQDYILDQIRSQVMVTFEGCREADTIFDEVQERIIDDILEDMYYEGRNISSKQDFIDVLLGMPLTYDYTSILSEEMLDRFDPTSLDGSIVITFDDFDWLDADIISYHFVMSVLSLVWLAKTQNNR